MTQQAQRAGFALPMVIILLLLTTGAVMVTLNQGTTDRRVQDGDEASLKALALAETGLERLASPLLDDMTGSPAETLGPATLDGAEVGIPGAASVYATRMWMNDDESNADSAIYVVQSTGQVTAGGWGNAPAATRHVTRLVTWKKWPPTPIATGDMFPSAWTSISGLRKNGAAGSLDGNDAVKSPRLSDKYGIPCGAQPAKAGVAVPVNPGYSGQTKPVSGDPPVKYIGGNPEEAAASIDLDWETMSEESFWTTSGGQSKENVFRYPEDGAWNTIPWDNWPVVFVDNENGAAFPLEVGKGTLIITGDAVINGSNLWEGLVLVGGTLTSNGNNTVNGAVLSGLNVKLQEHVDVGVADVGNGTKTFQYNSCAMQDALQSLNNAGGSDSNTDVAVLRDTWLDTWALY